jgi:hypothetical protein
MTAFTKACTGVICGVLGLGGLATALSPLAEATPAEESYYQELFQVAHPMVNESLLLYLGEQTCTVRRSGQSTDAAKVAVYNTTQAKGGVIPSNAEVGTLVHVAIDNLCPEVGYP